MSTKLWVLEYNNGIISIYVAPDERTSMNKKFAEKYETKVDAEAEIAKRPQLLLFKPVEYEFDFEPSPKEEINSSI